MQWYKVIQVYVSPLGDIINSKIIIICLSAFNEYSTQDEPST